MTLTEKQTHEIIRLRDELHNANLRADKAERDCIEKDARIKTLTTALNLALDALDRGRK